MECQAEQSVESIYVHAGGVRIITTVPKGSTRSTYKFEASKSVCLRHP